MPESIVTNEDCMLGMARYPDKYFELAIVDPPYGINGHAEIGVKKGQKESKWMLKKWDTIRPSKQYFNELRRISQNQIIWGGNYFNLPPTRCVLVWDKVQRIDMADCEIAWTSFDTSARIYTYARSNIQGFRNPNRFHPCEKPIALYSWLLKNYAKSGDKILDSHLGSGSSRIACYKAGYDFTGFELDKDYFEAQEKRFKNFISQETMQFQES
jgi:site-specific DNA-methyltransferase (adenine-specific)